MEFVERSRRYSAMFATHIWFRLCICTGLSILIPVIIVSGSVMAAHREMADPFFAVGNLFDGDARQVALAHGFTCQNPKYSVTLSDFCTQLNRDQAYSATFLRISSSMAKEVDLTIPENTLTLGDLVLLWGKPETHRYCQTLVFSWAIHQITAAVAVPQTRRINYFAPILYISFVREALSYWEQGLLIGCEV